MNSMRIQTLHQVYWW